MDISQKSCASYPREYNGQPGVDEACAAFFAKRPTTLGECWRIVK